MSCKTARQTAYESRPSLSAADQTALDSECANLMESNTANKDCSKSNVFWLKIITYIHSFSSF